MAVGVVGTRPREEDLVGVVVVVMVEVYLLLKPVCDENKNACFYSQCVIGMISQTPAPTQTKSKVFLVDSEATHQEVFV